MFKKIKFGRFLAGIVLLVSLIPWSFAIAGEATLSPSPSVNPAMNSWFCTHIDEFEDRSEGRQYEREKRLADRRDQSDQDSVGDWVEDETNRFNRDFEWDDRRADRLAAFWLRRSPTGSASALSSFQSSVDSLISQSQSQIQTAISSYQSSVLQMIPERRQAIDQALERFASSVRAAVAKAKADCAAGRDPRAAREEFRQSLRVAGSRLHDDLQIVRDFQSRIRELKSDRRDIFRTITRQLDSELDRVKDELRAALR